VDGLGPLDGLGYLLGLRRVNRSTMCQTFGALPIAFGRLVRDPKADIGGNNSE